MPDVLDMPVAEDRPLLERLVFQGIVFNMSWEDPEMDRQAFRLTSEDTVISITSAGCNPLNFLCQSPQEAHQHRRQPGPERDPRAQTGGDQDARSRGFLRHFCRPPTGRRHQGLPRSPAAEPVAALP